MVAKASPPPKPEVLVCYTYTNSDQRTPQIPGSGIISSLVIPDHQFAAVVTQRIGRRAFINFDLTTTSDYLAPIFDANTFASRPYRFRGLAKVDLGGSYTLPLNESRSLRLFGYV